MTTTTILGLVLRTTALLALTGAVSMLLARRSAALRHFLWSLAITGALAMPVLSTALPWSWQVLPARAVAVARSTAEISPSTPDVPGTTFDAPVAAATRTVVSTPSTVRAADQSGRDRAFADLSATTLALGLWAVVACLLLVHFVAGRLTLAVMARRAAPFTDARILAEMSRIVRAAGLRRPVRLLRGSARMPLTWGVRRPVVMLPDDAASWDTERLRMVLEHELAHVRRFDDLTQSLARIASAVHWFNPLVWWAAARLRDESEHASDDLVLSSGERASEYARHLLELVSNMGPGRAPSGALPLAQRSRFEGRLLAILDPARTRGGVRARGALALGVVVAGLVTLLGVVAPARAEEGPATSGETRGGPEIVAPESGDVEEEAEARAVADEEVVEAAQNEDFGGAESAARRDSASVRALVRTLRQDSSDQVREAAAWALGQLEDRTASAALGEALRTDASVEVRRRAAWALGQIEDASSTAALGAALADDDSEVRRTAVWALGQIEAPEAVEPLIGVLADGAPDERQQAAWALGQIESPRAVGALSAALGDADPDVREQAAWALGQIESRDAVGPLMTRGLVDAVPAVRRQAAWALGQIEADEAVPALAKALADTDAQVAATAAWAIGQIEPATAPPALLDMVRAGTGKARTNALWALVQIEDPAAVDVLTDALRADDPQVRSMALRGLAEIRDERAIRAITELMDDPDPQVRAAAVRALAGKGGWGGDPRPQPRPRPRPRPNGG